MVLKAAEWVHGTIVEPEDTSSLKSILRRGWGTTFVAKAGTKTWFHIPITTPVILDGKRPVLSKVFVFFSTVGSENPPIFPQAAITNLHIYDGKSPVKKFDNLNLYGEHQGSIDTKNTWEFSPALTIYSGLGLSIGVSFLKAPMGPDDVQITFATAGADFNNS